MKPIRVRSQVVLARALVATFIFIHTAMLNAEDEESASELPVWLLLEAKKIADGNRYFDPNHIDLIVPEELWSDAPLSSLEHPTPIDFDNDGLMDLLLEQAVGWDGPGGSIPNNDENLYAPSNSILMAYRQVEAGEYQIVTQAVFGEALVEYGDLSRKVFVADVNSDGFKDVVGCLTREDGRAMSYEQGYLNWNSQQKVIVSNGDGTYRIDALSGDPIYQHGCTIAKMQDGSQHIIYGVGPGVSALVYRYQAERALVVSGYPSLTGWDERALSPDNSQENGYSKYLISSLTGEDKGARIFEQIGSQWMEYGTHIFGQNLGPVDFTWRDNPGVQQQDIFLYDGQLRLSFGISDTCELRLTDEESVFVLKLDSQVVPQNYVEPIDMDNLEWDYVYTVLAMRNGAIQELDLLSEEKDYPMGFSHLCGDMTGDGLGDLSSIQSHGRSEVSFYKNDGQGGLIRTELKGLEAIETLQVGTVTNPEQVRLIDINGDGIGDWLQAARGTLRINFGTKPQ